MLFLSHRFIVRENKLCIKIPQQKISKQIPVLIFTFFNNRTGKRNLCQPNIIVTVCRTRKISSIFHYVCVWCSIKILNNSEVDHVEKIGLDPKWWFHQHNSGMTDRKTLLFTEGRAIFGDSPLIVPPLCFGGRGVLCPSGAQF